MSFVGNMLGFGGPNGSGMGYEAQQAPLDKPVTVGQANAANDTSNGALSYQRQFLNALGGQAALDNQTAQQAGADQILRDLYTSNGIGNQASVFNRQAATADQLQNIANGNGPNPALAQLNQTTGQNIAAQAALMGGQRGSNSNAGLLARQIANNGAGIQQNAVGQAATMRANQQLAGLSALQQQEAAMGNVAGNQVGQTQAAQNAAAALAGQRVAQQQAGNQAYTNAAQGQQQLLLNSINAANNATAQQQSSANSANASIQGQVAKGQAGLLGGIGGAAAGLAGGGSSGGAGGLAAMGYNGGMVQKMADGGLARQQPMQQPDPITMQAANMSATPAVVPQDPRSVPQSRVGKILNKTFDKANYGGDEMEKSGYDTGKSLGDGLVSLGKSIFGSSNAAPTQASLPINDSGLNNMEAAPAMYENAPNTMSKGGPVVGEMLASKGKMVPGKAKVKGNSIKNDTVPAILSPGEIVIPRSISQSDDAPTKAAQFVAAVLARHGMKR